MTKELEQKNIILLIMPKDKYVNELMGFVKELSNAVTKTLYVSFNQPYSSIISKLDKNEINKDEFFVIDTVTSSVEKPIPVDNCTFVSAPNALTEVSVAISKYLNEGCDGAIFDSLSTLLVHDDVHPIMHFTHSIITKLRIKNDKAIFIALKEDINSELIKDLYMFMDGVIEVD